MFSIYDVPGIVFREVSRKALETGGMILATFTALTLLVQTHLILLTTPPIKRRHGEAE